MGETPSSFETLFAELSRRRVFRVMAIYGPASFGVLQLADIAFPALGLPPGAIRVLLALVMAGFPVSLLLAWLFDATPTGIRWTRQASPVELEAAAGASARRWPSALLGLGGMLVLFGTGWMTGRTTAVEHATVFELHLPEIDATAPSLAVLPFENLGGDENTRVMAVGLSDEIRSQLARRSDLRVVSRGSVFAPAVAGKRDRDLAAELGVQHLLAGTVRRAGTHYRVIVTLIDGASDTQLWSQSYEATAEVDDQFGVQMDVARRVVEELRTGVAGEAEPLEPLQPASSSLAQYWYRRAVDRMTGMAKTDRDSASAWLHRAVEIDPGYAAAWSALANVAAQRAFFDEIEGEDGIAADAARRAAAIAPGSPEAWLARGYLGRLEDDYEEAASAFESAAERAPSLAAAWLGLGEVLMRLGRWPESTMALEYAERLGPHDLAAMSTLRLNLSLRGAHAEANALNDRVLREYPADHAARGYQPLGLLLAGGDPEAAERRATELSLDPAQGGEGTVLLTLAVLRHDYTRSLALLDAGAVNGAEDLLWVPGGEQLISRGQVLAWGGDPAAAAVGDSLLTLLRAENMERGDYRIARAYGYLLTGRTRDALRDARWVDRRIGSGSEDHLIDLVRSFQLVNLYGRLGDLDAGFRVLSGLVGRPGRFHGTAWLRLHPAYDPYRADPRFAALLARGQRFEAEVARRGDANRT